MCTVRHVVWCWRGLGAVLKLLNDPKEVRRSLVAERRSLLITAFVLFFYEEDIGVRERFS